jgi:hypothetical protein
MQSDKSQESPLAKGNTDAANQELVVTIAPLGPDQATINSVLNNLPQHPSVQAHLQGAPHRVLSFALDAPIASDGKGTPAGPSNTYRASIYDYDKGQTLVINGQLDQPAAIDVSIRRDDQVPNSEEFAAAV